nr:DUF1614 domain-containing protein [Candidatus Njordarchaeota archaeon]
MSENRSNNGSNVFYRFHHYKIDLILFAVLLVVLSFIFIGLIGGAFNNIGISWDVAMLILLGSLLGSWVNIPIAKVTTSRETVTQQYVEFFGVIFRVPARTQAKTPTTVAINVGGALIPIIISIYLFLKVPPLIQFALVPIVLVSAVMYLVARPVRGLGIAAPALVAPLVAAGLAILLGHPYAPYVAFVSGVLGTLIGADIAHLKDVFKSGPRIAAIGGAGTFDGIFLSGILAAILA